MGTMEGELLGKHSVRRVGAKQVSSKNYQHSENDARAAEIKVNDIEIDITLS